MSSTGQVPELESLRLQIADLARELAARDQSIRTQSQQLEQTMQDLRAQSDLLKAILEGTASDTGDEFFASLAIHLTASLHMQYAVIGEIVDGTPVTIRTVAVASRGTLLDNFEYDLTQAPCGTGLTKSFWCYEQDVQTLFPNFPRLATLGVDSHSGVSIRNKQGDAVGLIVVMDTKPITNQERLQALLHGFAPRVAAELQRKRTETELKEQTQRLAHAQALAHLGSWDWEIGSGRMKWSDEQFRIFGHEPSPVAATHETFLAALLPDDHDRVLAAMNATLVDHAPFDLECRIVRPNGEIRVIHARGDVHRDATGHPLSMAGTALDITERKQVEEALRTSEERWHLAVRGSNDGIWDWNVQTGEVFFSARWKTMRGFEDHEIKNHVDEWRSRIHPDDLDRVLQSIDAYLAKHAPELCEEYRVQRKDGSYMWILDRGVALWADDGTPLRMAGSESDITERKRAEESLCQNRALLQSFVEHTPAAVAMLDRDLRYVAVSKRWYQDYQLGDRDIIGLHHYDVFPEIRKIEHWQVIHRRCLAGEIARNDEDRFVREDGKEDWLRWEVRPWTDEAGSIGGIIMFTEVVTERKQAEAALTHSRNLLQSVIQTTPIGVFWKDRESRYLGCNQIFAKDAGETTPEHVVGKLDYDLAWKKQAELYRADDRLVMESGLPKLDLEEPQTTPDGKLIWLRTSKVPLRDETNQIIGVLGVYEDITERKRAEEERQKALTLLINVINTTPDLIFVKDRNLRTILCNNVFAQVIGKAPEDVIGHTDIENGWDPELVHGNPDKGIRGFEADDRQALSGRIVHNPADPANVAGEIRMFDAYRVPLRSETGEVIGVLGIARDITERKRMEVELKLSEARLNEAQRVAHIGSWELDIIANRLWWSDEVFRIFEIDPTRFGASYEAFLDIVHPEDRQFVDRSYTESLASRTPYSIEHRLLLPDGRVKHVHERCETFYDTAGKPIRSLGTAQDITERKQAEEALHISEERFNLAVRGSNTGIWDWDLRTNKTYFSPLWKSMLGYEEHELLGEFSEWEERLHPDDRERSLATVQAYLDGTTPQYELEHRLRHKDGSYRWILARGVSISDAEGKPYRMAGSHIDITEQKQTQEALAHRERQLRTVLHALPVGVWFTDTTGKVRLANPAGRQIWAGVQQVGLEGTEGHPRWWENVSSSGEPHRWALARALTKGEATLNEELSIQCLDGTSKVILNSAVALFGENGQVSGAIIVNQDITERKALERDRTQTQAFLQSILENIPHIITVKDAKTLKIVQMNRAAEQVLRLDRHMLADKTLYDCLPEGEANALWAADMDALQRRTLVEVPEHVVKREGERERIFRTKKAPILDAEGEPQYILTISEDITERTTAEAAVRQRAEHIIRFQQARLRLTKVDHVDQAAAWKTITETAGSALGVERVSIWLFNEDRSAIVCRDLYGLSTQSHEQGAVLEARHYPKYFEALASDVALATSDARTDPRTDEFREHYLPLFGITSMMDAPIHLHGNVVGVLCHEHTGPPREWTSEEQSFAASVADQVALSLEAEERALAEIALRSTKNQLQAILDHSPAVIFVKDTEGHYLLINRRYEELHQVSPNEVIGKTDYDIFDRDTADGLRSNDRKVLQTGCPLSLEETVPVENGILTVISTKFPLKDANGRPYAVCGIATDITERKRAEDALRQSHTFIRQIIDADPNFIFVKDRDGRFTLVNKAVADAYGTTVDFLMGKTDADFNANPDEVEFFSLKDLEVMDSLQERFIPEEVIIDSAGRTRWLQTVKRPILNETGRAIMVLGASTDITERKRIEEALRQRERDLRVAIEERERISQDLHDGILQSLFAVGLTLETTKSMMSPRSRKTSSPPLNQAIEQLNLVMHEIRNFIAGLGSDLLQGKDLPTALQHMLDSMTQNHTTRVRLVVEDRAAQAVSAEQSLHLLLVIQEAVSNCIRHGRAQEATVSLKMLKQGVRLSIRDNGRGFNPDVAKGTGHGLSNMAARAQKIGGRFTVLSKVNEGTRIVLDLPKEASSVRH